MPALIPAIGHILFVLYKKAHLLTDKCGTLVGL